MAELKHGEPCVQQPQKQIYAKFKTIFLFINFINSKRRLKHVTHISPPLSLARSLSRQLRSDPLLTYWPRTLISLECFSLSHL